MEPDEYKGLMSTWAVVLLVIALNALLFLVFGPLVRRWKEGAAARIA
jgi:hypothetical protein